MRCPICGAKLYQKTICPYCKITADQVKFASNKKAKKYRKSGRKDLVHFTTVLPQDVSRVKLWLFTIFLGWCGVNHFIVGRNIRGGFATITSAGSVIMTVIKIFGNVVARGWMLLTLNLIYEIIFYAMAINVILWICDIFALITKSFKVPVVLAEKGEIKND